MVVESAHSSCPLTALPYHGLIYFVSVQPTHLPDPKAMGDGVHLNLSGHHFGSEVGTERMVTYETYRNEDLSLDGLNRTFPGQNEMANQRDHEP
jgi:hypothetical protein